MVTAEVWGIYPSRQQVLFRWSDGEHSTQFVVDCSRYNGDWCFHCATARCEHVVEARRVLGLPPEHEYVKEPDRAWDTGGEL